MKILCKIIILFIIHIFLIKKLCKTYKKHLTKVENVSAASYI